MPLSTNTTYRLYAEKLGGTDPSQFVGNEGEVFLNPSVPTLKLSDGSTPGGTDIGGSGGGIGTDGSVNTTGIITASSFSGTTATFSGNVSVGGTLTYEDVTNVDSIGLITARTGIEVLSGIVTTPKLHVDSVGSGITFSEDLVVQGNARVTGILSIGTSSIVLDSNAKVIRGVEQIRIHSPEQNQKPIIIKQSTEKIVFVKTEEVGGVEVETDQEVSVGIGSTANINTTGIITASSFVGDGSGLTIGVEDLDDFALNIAPGQSISRIPVAKTNNNASGEVGINNLPSGFTYWHFDPEGRGTGTVLDSIEAASSFPIDVVINGTTIEIQSIAVNLTHPQGPKITLYHTNWRSSSDLADPSSPWSLQLTNPPTQSLADGDILQYVSAESKFKPARVSIGTDGNINTTGIITASSFVGDGTGLTGIVTSVNTQTGAVSLGVEDLDDFQLQATPPVSSYNDAKQTDGDFSGAGSTTGGFALYTSLTTHDSIYINKNNPTSGTSLASQGFTAGTNLDLWVSADGVNFTQHTATNSFNQGANNAQFHRMSPDLTAYSSANALYFSLTSVAGTPIALADGDILQYESSTSKFRPAQAAGVRSLLGIGEYADDTAAGTGGLSSGEMYYNTTSSSYVLKT